MQGIQWEVLLMKERCGAYGYGFYIKRENIDKCKRWDKAGPYQIGILVENIYQFDSVEIKYANSMRDMQNEEEEVIQNLTFWYHKIEVNDSTNQE